MGFADVYTVVTRESNANPNVTSGADEITTVFWYFGRHNTAKSVWNYLGLAPVLFGLTWMLL